jgi:hypothetical protein
MAAVDYPSALTKRLLNCVNEGLKKRCKSLPAPFEERWETEGAAVLQRGTEG